MKTLENIKTTLGESSKVAIGRELTKIYEEIKIGTVSDIISYYQTNTLKGEIVGLIFAENKEETDDSSIIERIKILQKQGFSAKDTVKIITSLFGESKNRVYELTQTIYNGR